MSAFDQAVARAKPAILESIRIASASVANGAPGGRSRSVLASVWDDEVLDRALSDLRDKGLIAHANGVWFLRRRGGGR